MLQKNKKSADYSEPDNEQGFITMIILMVVILGVVIYLAYRRVAG
jgi:hypothetical protein